MKIIIPGIPHLENIRNIILDFGGVICDLDINRTKEKFRQLGISTFDSEYSVKERDDLYRNFERGTLSPGEFRDALRKAFTGPVTDAQIDDAWNAMLLDIPEARVRLLEKLANHYRVFILSNSNEIHYLKYAADFKVKYGYHDFDELVEKAYFSFRLHLQKPGKEIFEFVIFDRGLNPGETLFIDDSVMHIEGAKKAGLIAYQLRIAEGEQLTDLFTKE